MILQPLHRQVGDKSLKKKEFILPFSTGQLSGCVFTVGGWGGGQFSTGISKTITYHGPTH